MNRTVPTSANRAYGGAPDEPAHNGLTTRQLEVLALLVDGMSDKEISAKLDLSPFTVHRYVRQIVKALDTSSRTEAVVRAIRQGILEGSGQ